MLRLLCAAVFLLASMGTTPALAQTNAQTERGMKVFAESKCSMCHSIAGKGNAKGPLDDVGAKYTAAEIRQWITEPQVMREAHKSERKPLMKAYTAMPKDDLDGLVAYLQTLKAKTK
jgi:mono/diheme cytochrome c family protein